MLYGLISRFLKEVYTEFIAYDNIYINALPQDFMRTD